MRAMPPAYIGLMLFVLILGLSLSQAPVFGDADVAWHLAAGDLIRTTGYIPAHDPWSFTAKGEHWYNLSWLADAGMSALFALGGFSALYTLTILIFAGSLTFMAHLCIRRGASSMAVFMLALPAAVALWGGVSARPAMYSVVMAVIFYTCLQCYRETGRLKVMLALPPLMALWVNLHGGFLIAFLLIGIFLVEAAWQRDRRRVREYGLIIALCLAATLTNPYGFALYYGAYRTLTTVCAPYIMEWQPAQIGHNMPVTILLLLVLVTGNPFDKRIPLSDRILTIIMIMLSLLSLRYSVFAALLLMPTLSLRLTSLLYDSAVGGRWRERDTAFMQDMQKPDIKIGGVVMALLAFIFICTPVPRDMLLGEPIGFPKKHFPVAEAAYIAEHYPTLHFFNDYNIGGYLDYLWRGKVKVFVDGRASSLYSEELLSDYAKFTETAGFGGRAEMIAAYYHLDGLIIPNDAPNANLWAWNPEWKAAYRGTVATVYIRKGLEDKKKRAGNKA